MKSITSFRPAGLWRLQPLFCVLVIWLGALFGRANAGVESLEGRYVGAWTNLTFGSTGAALIGLQLSGTTATLQFKMDGPVFGLVAPPPISMPGSVVGNSIQIDNHGVGIFGNIAGSINGDTGAFHVELTNIPGGFIDHVVADGAFQNGTLQLNYTVYFPGAAGPTNPAKGVLGAPLVLSITSVQKQDANLVLRWSGAKAPYQLQVGTDLKSGPWQNSGSAVSTSTVSLPLAQAPRSFFRIVGN